MVSWILGICAAVSLIFLIYPYAGYSIVLQCMRAQPVQLGPLDAGDGSSYSFLFCAYNEAAALNSKMANMRALKDRYPAAEFLAFDDGSSDGTAERLAADVPFVYLYRGTGRQGKAHGMKLLASFASRRFLVFTDANVTLELDVLDRLAGYYSDPSIGGVCGSLRYVDSNLSATAAAGGLYWRMEERTKDYESRVGNVMGADGSIFSTKREFYPNFPDSVLDDFTVSMEPIFRGFRLIKAKDVIAYEDLVKDSGDEIRRKIRIAARAYHTHRFLRSRLMSMSVLDRFKYVSHKYLRWFGAVFIMLFLGLVESVLFIQQPLLAAAACAAILLFLLYAKLRPWSGAAMLYEALLAMFATLFGVLKAMRGQTFTTWTPAASRDSSVS